MLSTFRKARNSWIVVGLLGLVMIAFILTGVGTGGRGGMGQMGFGPERLVAVGDQAITAPQLNQQLERELNQARAQNPEIDMPRLVASGAFDAILTQLVNTAVLTEFASDHGIAASKRMVDGVIAGIPGFQNAAGKFDETQFRDALAQVKVTEDQLRHDIQDQLIQRQLLLPVAASPYVPETLAREYGALLLEERTGTVGLVPVRAVGPGTDPTAPEVAAYFKKHQTRYTIPERRVLRYAVFGAPQVAAAANPTDAEIAAAYKERSAEFAAKETRTLRQVVLTDQAAAAAFTARLKSGKTFVQTAAEAGFSANDIALGAKTKADLARQSSPQVAEVAFGIAKGGITAPVRSPLGWHILQVDAVTVTPVRPLSEVRSALAAQVAARKAEDALAALGTRIEDSIADGATFDEVVKANGLQAQETAPVTASGAAPDVAGYQLPTDAGPLLKNGFDLAPDDDPVVETIVNGQRFAMLTVGRIVPAAPPPLAQIADRVKADLVQERSSSRARAIAQGIADKANAGMSLRDALAGAGVPLPGVQPLRVRRMDISQRDREVPPVLELLFGLPRGKARILAAPNNVGWFVVRLDEVKPGNVAKAPGLVAATRSQFAQVIGEEYAEQFAKAAERAVSVDRNEKAIKRTRAQLQRNAAVE